MNKFFAEMIGTFALIFLGCASIVFMGNHIGLLGIGMTFGLVVMVMIYALGPISGAHLNPAVSFGAFLAGALRFKTFLFYIVAQCLGSLIAVSLLLFIASGKTGGYNPQISGLGETIWGGYRMPVIFVTEMILTFLFVMVILSVTNVKNNTTHAGLIIGLLLVAINLAAIDISGASVNPARSLAPAVFVSGTALKQLWLYILAPLAGGGLAGLFSRLWLFRAL